MILGEKKEDLWIMVIGLINKVSMKAKMVQKEMNLEFSSNTIRFRLINVYIVTINYVKAKKQNDKNTRNCQEKVKKISHLKPNQLAPSIYIMKELCFFSLDQ